ncbi:MAG: AEC family transporter [Campylobacteraceae bacterium]|nr:AEC family transporter [Campylobacteraceae bacterium]
MSTLFSALAPIFALIFIGYGLKRLHFPKEDFWPQLDRLTYYILIPSLLVHKLSTATLDSTTDALVMVKVIFVSLITLSLLLLLVQRFLRFSGPVFTSIYQGATRYNTYVYLALIATLFGDEGIVLAAFLITFAIPFLNILSVTIFSIYVREGKFSFINFSKFIISNPLILACLLGGFLNFSTIGLPFGLEPLLAMLGAPGIPLGLLSIGVGLKLRSLGTFNIDFWFSSLAKLIVLPIITAGFCLFFDIDGIMASIVILFAAMPTATSAYILARQMGGDADLMSTLITGQTLLAFGSLAVLLNFLS